MRIKLSLLPRKLHPHLRLRHRCGSCRDADGYVRRKRENDPLAAFGPSSGTLVGNRALELRDEVLRLRSSVNLNASEFSLLRSNGAAGAVQYHSTVAAITARLQMARRAATRSCYANGKKPKPA